MNRVVLAAPTAAPALARFADAVREAYERWRAQDRPLTRAIEQEGIRL